MFNSTHCLCEVKSVFQFGGPSIRSLVYNHWATKSSVTAQVRAHFSHMENIPTCKIDYKIKISDKPHVDAANSHTSGKFILSLNIFILKV